MSPTVVADPQKTQILRKKTQRDRLLGKFPQHVASALVEFASAISEIDADIVIFMARKALRLHDFLMLAGCKPSRRLVLSSHVLEQDLSVFRDKRVVLVDDTLILGSTLGRATKRLTDAGAASVTSYVLAVDVDNWCADLVVPDKIFLRLNHDEMLTLCANEVEALATSGIPYLSDFPISKAMRFTSKRLDMFLSLQNWTAYPLTSASQDAVGTMNFSLLPSMITRGRLLEALGPFRKVADIMKVRAYGQTVDGAHWLRFVPVVTLKPLRIASVQRLWTNVIHHSGFSAVQIDALNRCFQTPKARMRLMQYHVALTVGRVFSADLADASCVGKALAFDKVEAIRLFGHWHRSAIDILHDRTGGIEAVRQVTPDAVPQDADEVAQAELQVFSQDIAGVHQTGDFRNVFTDLARAFTGLHRTYELRAREEAHALGKALFEDGVNAEHRDRLEIGYPWQSLVEATLRNENRRPTVERSMGLSLVLDVLIDMGIAVPLLCEHNGIIFRAYRHGEDVSFTDQEAALTYDVLEGYLAASGATHATKVVFQKLVTCLFRVGVSKNFLTEVHGVGGGERVVRIGYHLHGAVPFIPFDHNEEIFADDQPSWFSSYVVEDEIIKAVPNGFVLGTRPEAALTSSGAQAEATQLGMLIGMLMAAKESDGSPLLDERGLTLLASCPQPKDTASALAAELRIFIREFKRFAPRLRASRPGLQGGLDWINATAIASILTKMRSNYGYTALHSARMKLVGFYADRPEQIYLACEQYLRRQPNGAFFASSWRSAWAPIIKTKNDDQIEVFGGLIADIQTELFHFALGTFSIELALRSGEITAGGGASVNGKYVADCRKVRSYLQEMRDHVLLDDKAEELYARLISVTMPGAEQLMLDPARVCQFGSRYIERRHSSAMAVLRRASNRISTYGVTDPPTYFTYALWYDIINSTGEKSQLNRDAMKEYRERVAAFKEKADAELGAQIRAGADEGTKIYCWNAPLDSKDDEKNIFGTGRHAMSRMQEILSVLIKLAADHGVRLRLIMVNGDFVGERPFKYRRDVFVGGQSFWEIFSRVKAGVKALEGGMPSSEGSLVWLAHDLTSDISKRFSQFRWRPPIMQRQIEVRIENSPIYIPVAGGLIR